MPGADLGKAYVQIVPSAEGISGKISQLLSGESSAAGAASGRLFSGSFGKVIGAAGGLFTAKAATDLFKDVMTAGMEFDSAMSQVAATMGTTVNQITDLRDAAREAGRTTRYTAEQSAEALNYMALAGYDADTSMQMLPTVLNLAAAGGMDLALASDMITDSQSALNLSLDDTSRLVDQMARASSRSNTSVAQLGEAILTVGGNANFMAGGTTELSTVLGVLADNGIKGAEGGTHLRNMLLSLADPTKDARDTMERLGVSIFDADGNMRAFADFFPELQQALAGLTSEDQMAALSDIFNTRDMAAAQALLSTTTERWNELTGAIDASAGAAQQMADTQMDNLEGDVMQLKNAFGDLQLTIAEKATPTARFFVQTLTDGMSTLNQLMNGTLGGTQEALDASAQASRNYAQELINNLYPTNAQVQQKKNEASPLFTGSGLALSQDLSAGYRTGITPFLRSAGDDGKTATGKFAQGITGGKGQVGTAATGTATSAKTPMQNALAGTGVWGLHGVQNFASGMRAGIPYVSSAANAVAAAASGPLKHSVPEFGPMADDDVWGAHMVQNLIGGMERETPNLRRQVDTTAQIVRDGMRFDAEVSRTGARGAQTAAGSDAMITELRALRSDIQNLRLSVGMDELAVSMNRKLGQTKLSTDRRALA